MSNMVQPIRSKKEIDRMKRALKPGRDRLLFIVGINVALRISDLLQLKVRDVRNKDVLPIRETKTGKVKLIRLNNAVKRAVKVYVPEDANDDDYLFPSRKGKNKPITRQQAYNIIVDAAKRAGLDAENIGTHTMRKTFGYFAFKAGTPLAVLMALFNHANERITSAYIGITQDTVDSVYESVEL